MPYVLLVWIMSFFSSKVTKCPIPPVLILRFLTVPTVMANRVRTNCFQGGAGLLCAHRCTQRWPDLSIFLFCIMLSAWTFLNFPVEGNHPENRICHRTPEMVRRRKVNSKARRKAHSRGGKRSSLLPDRPASDRLHRIDLWFRHCGLFQEDHARWLHKIT